jgi:hypothetical protein
VKLGPETDMVRTVHGVEHVFNKGWNVQITHRGEV